MASRRSEERDRAYELWRASGGTMKLVDIANELSVTASKVRKWKTLDQWSMIGKTLPYENNTSDGIILSKGRGAPLGNKNSVGHKSSSPQKNANAVTTGEYQPNNMGRCHKRRREGNTEISRHESIYRD